MGLESRLLFGVLAATVAVGCGNGSNISDHTNPGCTSQCDTDAQGNNEAGSGNTGRDGGYDLFDGNEANAPPNSRFVYEEGHPLAGQPYTSRNVRRMTAVPYVADVTDPNGDPIECRFEFSDGYARGWESDPRVIHPLPTGDYTVTARTRDSRGMEGSPRTVDLHVMDNVPPVARLADCPETDPSDGLCVYRMGAWDTYCWDGSPSYDEDGSISRYKASLSPGATRLVSPTPQVCGGYNTPGTYEGQFFVEDNEGLEGSGPSFRSIVE